MILWQCPNCRKKVSAKLKVCPHCGIRQSNIAEFEAAIIKRDRIERKGK
jgi:ABC-type ATPase with predicted acetyltransferase domain